MQMHNDKALVTGVGLKKVIFKQSPHKLLKQMHKFYLSSKPDAEMINIITQAGSTAEKWDKSKKSLGLKKTITETRSTV